MAAMTLRRARRWAVGLPIAAAAAAFAVYGLSRIESIGALHYFDERTMYVTGFYYVAFGVVFACYAGAAAWTSGAARTRPIATGAAVFWGLAFGWWFSFATLRLTYAMFNAVPIADDLGGGRLWQRLLGMALGIAGAGAGTSLVLWWLTRTRRVVQWSLIIGGAAAALSCVQAWWDFGFQVVIALWHAAMAALLGRWVVWELRRQSSGLACTECGYDLTGNTSGLCPECGRPAPPKP